MSDDSQDDQRRATGVSLFARMMQLDESAVAAEMAQAMGERMAEDTLRATGAAWSGPELAPRDRSLAVVASLISLGGFEARLRTHLRLARENGVTQAELEAVVALLAVYVGFPCAAGALAVVREPASW